MAGGGSGPGSGGGGGGGGVSTPKAATLVVDKTPGQGDFTTIAAAVAALPAEGGYILLRESATPYTLSASVDDGGKNIVIRGCGPGSTIIDIGANAIPAFTVGGGGVASRIKFEDLTLSSGGAAAGQIAVQVAGPDCGSIEFSNVEFVNFDLVLDDSGGFATSLYFRKCQSVVSPPDRFIDLGASIATSVVIADSNFFSTNDFLVGFALIRASNSKILALNGKIELLKGSIDGCEIGGNINCDGSAVVGSTGVLISSSLVSLGRVKFFDNFHSFCNSRIAVNSGTAGIEVTGQKCIVSSSGYDGPGLFVVESGGADLNTYCDNVSFAGSTVIGPDSIVDEPSEQQLGLPFFRKQGLLLDEIFLEGLYDFPTPDFQNLAGGALTPLMSSLRFVGVGAVTANFGWNLLASKSKVQVMLQTQRPRANDIGIFFSNTLPVAGEVPDGSYFITTAVGLYVLYKKVGGVFTELTRNSVIDNGTPTLDSGLFFHYDSVTHRLVVAIRTSPECWFPVIDHTDASFATMQYAGLRFFGAGTWYNNCPITIRTAA